MVVGWCECECGDDVYAGWLVMGDVRVDVADDV